jgi:hypothetical protein
MEKSIDDACFFKLVQSGYEEKTEAA